MWITLGESIAHVAVRFHYHTTILVFGEAAVILSIDQIAGTDKTARLILGNGWNVEIGRCHHLCTNQPYHITTEVSPDARNIRANNKRIIPVIQMVNTSVTATGATLRDVSAAAALQPWGNFAASDHLSDPDELSGQNVQLTVWTLKEQFGRGGGGWGDWDHANECSQLYEFYINLVI